MKLKYIGGLLTLGLLTACSGQGWFGSAQDAALRDNSDGKDWQGWGRTYGEQHFSPLEDINEGNVAQLGLASFNDLGPGHSTSAPVEAEGVLYVVTRHAIIHAIEAVSGKELWVYDSHAGEKAGKRMRVSWGTRGLSYWDGKVYTGTTDGRLIALDAKTGKEVWSVQTLQPDDARYITGAPRIFDGKVIIGHGGADNGPARGYVTTYDARTGQQLWRFYTVPGQPGVDKDETTQLAAKSWAGEWWKLGGGGTVWNAITYDADTDTVFLGTGNGFPWNHRLRSQGKGDNLFLSSIVALDGKTGKYKWHYQTNPGETWDYNASMDMELADLTIAGQTRKVLMTAPKNGFFYVIDRITGKLISAKPFADKVTWADHIDTASGRPVENPANRFANGKDFEMWPGFPGAHSWLPMAFSPKTRLVYIPTLEMGAVYSEQGVDMKGWKPQKDGVTDFSVNVGFAPKRAGNGQGTSYLQAYDPATQKRVWKVPTPGPYGGGVAATAGGLVFQGALDGKFSAYSASTGKRLWAFDAGAAVIAPPIVYAVGGKQYVSVITGNGTSLGAYSEFIPYAIDYHTQAHYVLTFALGGSAKLPPHPKVALKPADDPTYRADPAAEARGLGIAGQYCLSCHGSNAISGGTAPDLRASPIPVDANAFRTVVHDGALTANGMPQFAELTDAQLADIRQYLRAQAEIWRRKK